jgi:hypothetical protein
MAQAANIIASIRSRWLTNASLPGLVPGGLKAGLVPAPRVRPFASIVVTPTEREYTTGAYYVQNYDVSIGVWVGTGEMGKAGQIQSVLTTLLTANTKLALLSNNAWTLHISEEGAGIDESQERFYGQLTFIAGGRWTVQLQEQRY